MEAPKGGDFLILKIHFTLEKDEVAQKLAKSFPAGGELLHWGGRWGNLKRFPEFPSKPEQACPDLVTQHLCDLDEQLVRQLTHIREHVPCPLSPMILDSGARLVVKTGKMMPW